MALEDEKDEKKKTPLEKQREQIKDLLTNWVYNCRDEKLHSEGKNKIRVAYFTAIRNTLYVLTRVGFEFSDDLNSSIQRFSILFTQEPGKSRFSYRSRILKRDEDIFQLIESSVKSNLDGHQPVVTPDSVGSNLFDYVNQDGEVMGEMGPVQRVTERVRDADSLTGEGLRAIIFQDVLDSTLKDVMFADFILRSLAIELCIEISNTVYLQES